MADNARCECARVLESALNALTLVRMSWRTDAATTRLRLTPPRRRLSLSNAGQCGPRGVKQTLPAAATECAPAAREDHSKARQGTVASVASGRGWQIVAAARATEKAICGTLEWQPQHSHSRIRKNALGE